MIGDDIAAALPELRAQAESMMVDTCVIERPTGSEPSPTPPFEMVDTYATVYEGKCRVQRPGSSVGNNESVTGGVEFGINAATFQLPLSAAGVRRGDRVRVTGIGSSDPDLLGLTATVKANLTKTHPTKRTLVCEEVAP